MKPMTNKAFRFCVAFIYLSAISITIAQNSPVLAKSGVYNIRDYGAQGDGVTLATEAINQAVESCGAAGGGQVYFPPGRYLSGTIHLRSKVTLFLDAGSVLVGTTNLSLYQAFHPPADVPEAKFAGNWHRALLVADGVEDIAIMGSGIIDGNKVFDPRGEERMRGPHTILFGNSSNIVFRDVTFRDSANYAVFMENCSDVEVRNVKITGGWDGVHFRGWPERPCRNVTIAGCQFYTGDDSIAGRYWENVLITGCVINSSCNGIRLIGPAKDMIIQDCLFYGPGTQPHRSSKRRNMLAGIALQPGAWDATQGIMDNILISNITMRDVSTPFFFMLKPGNTAGKIEVDRVTATGAYYAPISVESWGGGVFERVVFRDVTVEFSGGGTAEQAKMEVKSPGTDARPLPVWGLYAKNVGVLSLDNVRFRLAKEDLRPVMSCENVVKLETIDFDYPKGTNDPVVLKQVKEVISRDSRKPL
jgi:polygalacturonase